MFTKKKKRRNLNKARLTFSKWLVLAIIILAEIDVQLTYVLAFFNKEIAETLGVAIVTEIIGVVITYSLKAYFETKAEKKQRLEDAKFGIENEVDFDGMDN